MINTMLNDRYTITKLLGKGSSGAVYRADDTYLKRPVAVKLMHTEHMGLEGSAMLLHEARAAARLSHPNVVMVFDVGKHDQEPFVVMELVPGKTLAEAPPKRFNAIIRVSQQVCAALHHAHEKELVHRDVKPANVIVTQEDVAKLTDFGLARVRDLRLESDDSFSGTVAYAAPEQATGDHVDHRADLYSLGIMMYELVAGNLPFTGESPVHVIMKHIKEPPVPPQEFNPNLPSALNELILHLLQKKASDRPGSAREVGYLLGILSDVYRVAVFNA